MIHIERRKGKGECKRACFLLPIIPDCFAVPVVEGSISDNPLVSPVRTGGSFGEGARRSSIAALYAGAGPLEAGERAAMVMTTHQVLKPVLRP
jgi:hypothetical protein